MANVNGITENMGELEKSIANIKEALESINNFNMYNGSIVDDKECYMVQSSKKTIYFNIVENKISIICGDVICSDGWRDYDKEELQEIEVFYNSLIKPGKQGL